MPDQTGFDFNEELTIDGGRLVCPRCGQEIAPPLLVCPRCFRPNEYVRPTNRRKVSQSRQPSKAQEAEWNYRLKRWNAEVAASLDGGMKQPKRG